MNKFANIFAVIVLMVGVAFAQTTPTTTATEYYGSHFAPYVEGFITNTPTSNNTVNGSVGAGVESNYEHLYVDANGLFNTTQATGGGYSGSFTAQAYAKFGYVLLGGGASFVENSNSFSTYFNHCEKAGVKGCAVLVQNSANPFVGGGVQVGRLRSIFTYTIPAANALPGQQQFNVNTEFAATKHIRVVVPVQITTYYDGIVSPTHSATVGQYGGGVKLVW